MNKGVLKKVAKKIQKAELALVITMGNNGEVEVFSSDKDAVFALMAIYVNSQENGLQDLSFIVNTLAGSGWEDIGGNIAD